jgi:FkbM family methyltransferase
MLNVQIGAGAGDRDSRAGYRDGFTEYIKSQGRSQNVLLVEPNPRNIPALKECWNGYKNVKISQIGIRPSKSADKIICFYYAEEDAPHFQTFSMSESHVKKHYPNALIKRIEVETKTAKEIFDTSPPIDLLAIDVEGIDREIMLDIDWLSSPCRRVSFEYVHFGGGAGEVYNKLETAGYLRTGYGLDPGKFDLMYEKPYSFYSMVSIWVRHILKGWWVIYPRPLKAALRRFLSF